MLITFMLQWHIENQNDAGRFCSLSCARRWVFLMCDNMNLETTFGITPQESKHLPRAVAASGVIVDVTRSSFLDDKAQDNKPSSGAKDRATKDNNDDDFSFSFRYSRKVSTVNSFLLSCKTAKQRIEYHYHID